MRFLNGVGTHGNKAMRKLKQKANKTMLFMLAVSLRAKFYSAMKRRTHVWLALVLVGDSALQVFIEALFKTQ